MKQENEELVNFSIGMDFNIRGRNQQFTEDGEWNKLVMQCFLVGYRGKRYLSLLFSLYTNLPH